MFVKKLYRTANCVRFARLTAIAILLAIPVSEIYGVQVLYGFDTDELHRIGADWFPSDGGQDAVVLGNVGLESGEGAAFGAKAASFSGASFAALEIPETKELGSAFTLAAMVNETSNNFSRLFSSYNGGSVANDELVFDIDPSTSIGFSVRAIVHGTAVTRNFNFADSEYHHLAMTYDNGSLKLFFDGSQLGATATVPGGPVILNKNLRFGEDYPPTSLTNELFQGFADDILVYDSALGASQILSLYQNGAAATFGVAPPPPPPPPPPIALGSKIEMFVDDRLLANVNNVGLKLHQPKEEEIALQLNGPYETTTSTYFTALRDEDNRVRLYYRGNVGSEEVTLMAISDDGVNFTRPNVAIYQHDGSFSNHIVWEGPQSHNMSPFIDTNPAAAPDAKYKALGGTGVMYAMKSADGIHWELMQAAPLAITGAFDSQNTAFWDAEAGLYRSFSRYWDGGVRAIQMSTSTDFINWTTPEPFQYDVPLQHFYTNAIVQVPGAENVFLGFPMRLDPSRTNLPSPGQSGVSDAVFITSRDGVHWDRIFAEPWIEEGFDTTRSKMPAWGIMETGDGEWSMYSTEMYRLPDNRLRRFTLRPYGFASVQADEETGWFETPKLTFDGTSLLLNYRTEGEGSIAVEIRDHEGNPIPGFTLAEMTPVSGDELAAHITWTSGRALSELIGQEVRLFFQMTMADLFSIQFAGSDLPGDYDGNRIVDQQDYEYWRSQFGRQGTNAADGNGDGSVNAADYVLWRDHLGSMTEPSTQTANVPEPACLQLVCVLIAMFWCGKVSLSVLPAANFRYSGA